MTHDKPPHDQEIVDLIASREGGMVPSELIDEFKQQYDLPDIIEALQRVFDRGLVQLGTGARLIVQTEKRRAFA